MAQKVRGFNLGAEDYIVKPFQLLEFQARISAKLRNLAAASTRTPSDYVEFGPFAVNLAAQKITLKQNQSAKELELTSNQFKVLYYFLRHEGKIVSREDLLKEIWGNKVHVSDRTIDTHIYSIRQELGTDQNFLQSVHGKGYRLTVKPSQRENSLEVVEHANCGRNLLVGRLSVVAFSERIKVRLITTSFNSCL